MRDIVLESSGDRRLVTDQRVTHITQRVMGYVAMFAVVLIIGIPVAWVLSGALKTNREIFSTTPQLLPANPTFENFGKAWRAAPFDRFYLNSFITTLLGAGAEVIMAVTTAYALVFVRFPKRDWVFILLLLALMVPEEVVIVPNYLTIAGWRMVNTYPGIVLPGASIAFGTFLLRQYFRTIPPDLIDAAKVDGAGHLRTLLSVVVPVAAPAVATTALLSITAKWNEYLWPLLITTTEDMRTLPVGISRLLDQEGNTEWGVVMAATLFVIVPVMLIFLYAQRFVVDGIASGAVKG
ncbi:MAG: carbohydrate ABC transporter permease [Thermoflexales bacterium]|nr:carbohydrate ABC transporter permease [Thermoflexales bacterium]MDW8351366.1 carbohydrate ABC transporter permease [Anaerolineae bacterium]